MSLSANNGAARSGLLALSDCVHCSSTAATAFSAVPSVAWACVPVATLSEIIPSKYNAVQFFILFALFVLSDSDPSAQRLGCLFQLDASHPPMSSSGPQPAGPFRPGAHARLRTINSK